MKKTLRLLAETSKYLEAGRPTGLTGLITHHSPRSALLYNYHTTLEKLRKFPESSVYRQSTEALTRHRLNIVESIEPAGLSEWQASVQDTVEKNPNAFRRIKASGSGNKDRVNIVYKFLAARSADSDAPSKKTNAEQQKAEAVDLESELERLANDEAAEPSAALAKHVAEDIIIDPEPPLTTTQIEEIESKIGAGLVEEIIQVAEAENDLVDQMYESKVWEELAVKPTEGQWAYYERDAHVGKTQAR